MDKENKNLNNENIDEIPDLNLEILDELVQEEKPQVPEVEDLIFDESDKINLFDDPEEEDEIVSILDEIESDLPSAADEDDDDLIFVDAVSVRDRRKIADIKITEVPENIEVEKKKTRRRTHDVNEIKTERFTAFARKNIAFIGIGILVLVIIIGGIAVGVKKYKENHSTVPKTSASEEAYQVEAQEAINELMNSYFVAVADNDTYTLNQILNPVFDNEMEYFRIMSEYVDKYENIVCYATDGMEDGEYIVAVYYELKYDKIKDAAPGMQYFYVATNTDGDLYINNLYSQHNLNYTESLPNSEIVNLMSAYQISPDMQSIMTQVQTNYDAALASNEELKEMVEVTLPVALADWRTTMEAYLSVQEGLLGEGSEGTGEGTVTDEPVVDEPATEVTETESTGTVYATDSVKIRQSPSTDAEVLASVTYGAELTSLAQTEDGWTKIKTGDITGYIKSEYLSTEKPAGTGVSAGTSITVSETVNVRADMSETAEKVTVVLGGEMVQVLEPDNNGWTKVQYGGVTGYIRTDLLR